MRYIGGKSKLAKSITEAILADTDRRKVIIEPFLGGGATAEQLVPQFQYSCLSDSHPDLMAMWEALLAGWEPEKVITPAQYDALKDAPTSALRGLVGFGGSFGGKWFGGYAKGGWNADLTPRNHQWESARAAMRIAATLRPFTPIMKLGDYSTTWDWREADVVYCDPPYASTQGYKGTGEFDTQKFWEYVGKWADHGAHVYVSEYEAPSGWVPIWDKPHRMSLTTTEQGRPQRTERLWRRA